MSLLRNVNIQSSDSFSIDAFGRLRVSEPYNIFDTKNIYDDDGLASNVENQPLFFDNQQISGSGTSTAYNVNQASQSLTVANNTAGRRIRQTKMRFNYQPGKSQEILMTFVFGAQVAGITQREGYFDDNNGIFLEDNGSTYGLVVRSYVDGSVSNNRIVKNNWNIDKFDGSGPSGVTIDFTKTQILFIDFAWLGVSRVRVGFVVNGLIYYAHEFVHANILTTVYMSTPNLPLRSEIINDGTGPERTLVQICSSVKSEGGVDDNGSIRYASTNGDQVVCATENITYAILGLRLKSQYIGATINISNISIQIQSSSEMCEWTFRLNPTVAGTFAYVSETNSAIQVARGATANTVTNGYSLIGGFINSGGSAVGSSGGSEKDINNAIRLGSLIDGTVDTLVLCATPRGGTSNVSVESGITWREIF